MIDIRQAKQGHQSENKSHDRLSLVAWKGQSGDAAGFVAKIRLECQAKKVRSDSTSPHNCHTPIYHTGTHARRGAMAIDARGAEALDYHVLPRQGGPKILSLEISDTHRDNVPRTPLVEGDDAARLRAKGAFLRASRSTPTLTPLDIQASTPVGDGLSVRYVATGLVSHHAGFLSPRKPPSRQCLQPCHQRSAPPG